MMKPLLAAGAILAGLLPTHAYATNNRTWISGKGVDQAGCGPVATPCRTLQYAHDNTNAGGEIDVLDPAGYGSVTITKAISIVNDGVGTAGVLATSGTAITINAGSSDSVTLRGLTIEGAQTALYGVAANSVGSLTIENCVVQGFTSGDIMYYTGGTLRISGTTLAGSHDAILLAPNSSVTAFDAIIDRVIVTGNQSNGLLVAGDGGGSGTIRVSVSNSLFSSNVDNGIRLYSGNLVITAVITDSVITANGTGLQVVGTSTGNLTLGRNTISHNTNKGVQIYSFIAQSYQNNQFANNGTDVNGTLTPTALK